MPQILLSSNMAKKIQTEMRNYDRNVKYTYYDGSLVRKYDVRRVPVKPSANRRMDPKIRQILMESRDGMLDFHPIGLIDINIGRNRGLQQIIRKVFDENAANPRTTYYVLTADCNIFLRTLKVIDGVRLGGGL